MDFQTASQTKSYKNHEMTTASDFFDHKDILRLDTSAPGHSVKVHKSKAFGKMLVEHDFEDF